MNKTAKIILSVLFLAALLWAAFALAQYGVYGWTLFALLPMIAGSSGVLILKPQTVGRATLIGCATGGSGCLLFLLMGREGYICVLMAIPFVVPLSLGGALLAYWFGHIKNARRSAATMCFLLPVSMFYDTTAEPPVYPVTTSIVVNAPRERVWKNVVAFPDIADEPDWMLSTGLAYPLRTRIDSSGVGALRDCDLSTGTVKERVVIWDQPHLLRFIVTETPPAMKERGLYGPITPKHLNGYYISKAGQFELTELPGGKTLVVGTSWYQHGLWPAEYWRLWSDTVVHHIHQRVLEHVKVLSEN